MGKFSSPFYSMPFFSDFDKLGPYIKKIPVNYSIGGEWGPASFSKDYLAKYTKPELFNANQFQCQSCYKPVDQSLIENYYDKNTVLLTFKCHGEINQISIAFELFEDLYKKPGQILDFIGPVFSNKFVRNKTQDILIWLRNPLDNKHLKELYDRLLLLAINSREALNMIKEANREFVSETYSSALGKVIYELEYKTKW